MLHKLNKRYSIFIFNMLSNEKKNSTRKANHNQSLKKQTLSNNSNNLIEDEQIDMSYAKIYDSSIPNNQKDSDCEYGPESNSETCSESYDNVKNYTDNTDSDEDNTDNTDNTYDLDSDISLSPENKNFTCNDNGMINYGVNITDIINEINIDRNKISKQSRIHPDGYLKIVVGCMFSGKTTYIIRELNKWKSIGKKVIVINYSADHRYTDEDKVVSHDRCSVDCVMIDSFTSDINNQIQDYDVVLVNEGQFFKNLNQNVRKWCDDMKKIVIVNSLDGDYRREEFGEILKLIPNCDEIIKLKALCTKCSDGTDAIFTWKLCNNNPNTDDIIDIGVDKYVPLCRKHHNKERAKLVIQHNKST
jgi:thymidine kinase